MTGIILAGGKSSRMGVNKALLTIGETRIIDGILAVYRKIFSEIIIVTNTPEAYKDCNVKIFEDIIPDCGPLGGIYTGLHLSRSQYCFVTACDMPFISVDIIRRIIRVQRRDIVVPEIEGQYEPLFALYSKGCLEAIERQLQHGNLRVRDLLKTCRFKVLTEKELHITSSNLLSFANINTPEEFKKALLKVENTSRC